MSNFCAGMPKTAKEYLTQMHWSEEIAQRIIAANPNKAEYVCSAGISPSGSVHIGNFRDIATSYFVCKALKKLGKKAKLIFSWDEYDRLRKVPKNVEELCFDYNKYIGLPYADAPDPYGVAKSYAKHFELEFEESLKRFGVDVEYRYQADEYRSGRYSELIVHSLRHRLKIFDILDSFRTQDSTEEDRSTYYPVSIYCQHCHKDTTTIHSLSEDCTVAEYSCSCGHSGAFDFTKDFSCKLPWKVDWAMRWRVEGVDFEPGGKDHASPTGSYSTSSIIAREIFGIEPPLFQGYEFIGIKGVAGKMSGSSGLNLTPDTLLRLYQPEVILWLYSKTEPNRAFDFCFSDEILRQYFEFDKMQAQVYDGTANDITRAIMENTVVNDRRPILVPMAHLVSFGSIVNFNPDMLETIFAKMGYSYTKEDFAERAALAEYWLENCSPESRTEVLRARNFAHYDTLDENARKEIALLSEFLNTTGYDLDTLRAELYAIPEKVRGKLEDKEKKAIQTALFKNIYQLLIGKNSGPRLYLFLFAIDKDSFLPLLDFSNYTHGEYTREQAELASVQPDDTSCEDIEDIPVEPIKPEITVEDFAKIDMRVCSVINCEEVAKSRSFLKLTVFDGIAERTIMSTIKGIYTPEQLIGKKIIVLANLEPKKFSGVPSNGMLLAATHDKCGCKIIFVDDCVPDGTAVN